jgi:hypothetical protein
MTTFGRGGGHRRASLPAWQELSRTGPWINDSTYSWVPAVVSLRAAAFALRRRSNLLTACRRSMTEAPNDRRSQISQTCGHVSAGSTHLRYPSGCSLALYDLLSKSSAHLSSHSAAPRGRCAVADGAREMRFPQSKRAQFVTVKGIVRTVSPFATSMRKAQVPPEKTLL